MLEVNLHDSVFKRGIHRREKAQEAQKRGKERFGGDGAAISPAVSFGTSAPFRGYSFASRGKK
jgi:hypothetical protein